MKSILTFFDKIEKRTRFWLSHHPILYSLIAGFAIVLFWRGVWDMMDLLDFMTPLVTTLVSVVILLLTGTFVSFFIGEELIISGIKEEKRIDQKTEQELRAEGAEIEHIENQVEVEDKKITHLDDDVEEIKTKVDTIQKMLMEEHK